MGIIDGRIGASALQKAVKRIVGGDVISDNITIRFYRVRTSSLKVASPRMWVVNVAVDAIVQQEPVDDGTAIDISPYDVAPAIDSISVGTLRGLVSGLWIVEDGKLPLSREKSMGHVL